MLCERQSTPQCGADQGVPAGLSVDHQKHSHQQALFVSEISFVVGTPYKAKEDQIVLLGQEKSFTIAQKKYSKYRLFKTIGFLQLYKVANQLLRGMKRSEEANNYSMCSSPDLHLNERWRSDCFQVLQASGKYLTT